MAKLYNTEFREALREIAQRVAYFNSPHDTLLRFPFKKQRQYDRTSCLRLFKARVEIIKRNGGKTINQVELIDIYLMKFCKQKRTDRVRIVEWSRRLAGIPDDSFDEIKNRNDYVQLLKIMVRGGRLHGIFLDPPPGNDIPPLAEAMCNFLCNKCKDLPNAGPLEPIVSRQTPDGCAHMSLRKIENKGILCYMAVSPDGLTMPEGGITDL